MAKSGSKLRGKGRGKATPGGKGSGDLSREEIEALEVEARAQARAVAAGTPLAGPRYRLWDELCAAGEAYLGLGPGEDPDGEAFRAFALCREKHRYWDRAYEAERAALGRAERAAARRAAHWAKQEAWTAAEERGLVRRPGPDGPVRVRPSQPARAPRPTSVPAPVPAPAPAPASRSRPSPAPAPRPARAPALAAPARPAPPRALFRRRGLVNKRDLAGIYGAETVARWDREKEDWRRKYGSASGRAKLRAVPRFKRRVKPGPGEERGGPRRGPAQGAGQWTYGRS